MSEVASKTQLAMQLMLLDDATKQDLFTKYALLADAYIGSAGKDMIVKNKDTYSILLNSTVVDFVLLMQQRGMLNNTMANYPNMTKMFDRNSDAYITKIVKKLSESGTVQLRKDIDINNVREAMSLWGIESTSDASGADVIDITSDDGADIGFQFDDIDMSDISFDEDEGMVSDGIDDIDDSGLLGDDAEDSEEDISFDEGDLEGYTEDNVTGPVEEPKKPEVTEAPKNEAVEEVKAAMATVGSLSQEDIDAAADNAGQDAVRELIEGRDKQIEDAIAAHRKAEEKRATDEAINSSIESSIDKSEITKVVNMIMASYDIMYQPLFQETPAGLLTSQGILTCKSDNSLQVRGGNGNAYAQIYMESIQNLVGNKLRELDYHEEISTKCINEDGSLKYNYIPNFHVRNIYGIYRGEDGTLQRENKWSEFRLKLVKILTKSVEKILTSFKGGPRERLQLGLNLVELFTTVFIVEDFDMNKSMKMTFKSMSISGKDHSLCSEIGKMIGDGRAFPIDTSTVDIVNNETGDQGVHQLLAVFDVNAYKSEVLFSYKPISKILESGGKIGLAQTLLGRDIKGRNVTYNFASPQAVDTLIIAGSGSGKGVVTLNILATMIASGSPVVYVDWKPDMAAMLWDMERATGARILAIDGLAGRTKDGQEPVRNYGIGHSMPKIPGITDTLNIIPYMKAFQSMIMCAQARNIGYMGMENTKKMYFILDEAQAMNKEMGKLKGEVETYLKENKPSKNNPETEDYKYVKKLKKFLDSMFSGAVTFRNTTGRTGNIGAILLGQQSDCTAWATGALKRDTFGFLVGNCSAKLLGKDAVDNTKYSLNGCTPKGSELLGGMGYFALVPRAVADKGSQDSIKVLKSYLVLNENDYVPGNPGRCTGTILTNQTDPNIKESIINNDYLNPDGTLNHRVGFQGLCEYIGSMMPDFNLNKNLESGYVEVETMLKGLGIIAPGRYRDVEQFWFDCSYDSLWSTSELLDLIKNGGTVDSLRESDDSYDGDEIQILGDDPFADISGGITGDFGDEAGNGGKQGTGTGANTGQGAAAAQGVGAAQFGGFGAPTAGTMTARMDEIQRRKAEQERRKAAEAAAAAQGGQTGPTQSTMTPPPNTTTRPIIKDTFDLGEEDEEDRSDRFVDETPPVGAQPGTISHRELADDEFEDTEEAFDSGFNNGYSAGHRNGHYAGYQQAIEDMQAQGIPVNNGRTRTVFTGATKPYEMPPTERTIYTSGGKTGRVVYMTPEETTDVLGLTPENSVLISMPEYDALESTAGRLFDSLWGTQYQFKKRWKRILDGVVPSSRAGMITRMTIMEDVIAFNKKTVATLNILGGDEDIRIEDIVEFKSTAKKFPNIREIILDQTIFARAQAEFDEPFDGIFNAFTRLDALAVMDHSTMKPVIMVNRQQLRDRNARAQADELAARAAAKNQLEAMAAAKNPNLKSKSPGYKNNVYKSCMEYSSAGWKNAGEAMTKNGNWGKGLGYAVGGVLTLGVGLVAGGFGLVGNLIRRK